MNIIDCLGYFIIIGFVLILGIIDAIGRWYEAYKYRKNTLL